MEALMQAQIKTEQSIQNLSFEVNRVLARLAPKVEEHEAKLETLTATVTRLLNNSEADRAESRAFRAEMRSTNQRFDTLIDYLMSRDGDDGTHQ